MEENRVQHFSLLIARSSRPNLKFKHQRGVLGENLSKY